MVCALNQQPVHGSISPIARIHRLRNHWVEMEMIPTQVNDDPLGKFLFSELTFCWPGTSILLNWKPRLPPGFFWLLMPLRQQTKKVITMLGEVINLDYSGEIGLFLQRGGEEDYVWSIGNPLGHPLVLLDPVIKLGELQQLNPGRMTKCSRPSGRKVWLAPLGQELRPAEVLAEGGGNTKGVVEESCYININSSHTTRCKNEDSNSQECFCLTLCFCIETHILA